jgi:hypothetical protein
MVVNALDHVANDMCETLLSGLFGAGAGADRPGTLVWVMRCLQAGPPAAAPSHRGVRGETQELGASFTRGSVSLSLTLSSRLARRKPCDSLEDGHVEAQR